MYVYGESQGTERSSLSAHPSGPARNNTLIAAASAPLPKALGTLMLCNEQLWFPSPPLGHAPGWHQDSSLCLVITKHRLSTLFPAPTPCTRCAQPAGVSVRCGTLGNTSGVGLTTLGFLFTSWSLSDQSTEAWGQVPQSAGQPGR